MQAWYHYSKHSEEPSRQQSHGNQIGPFGDCNGSDLHTMDAFCARSDRLNGVSVVVIWCNEVICMMIYEGLNDSRHFPKDWNNGENLLPFWYYHFSNFMLEQHAKISPSL